MQALKVVMLNMEAKPFAPDYVSLCQRWGSWWECILAFSLHFSVGVFSFIQCVGVTQLVSGYLSERIAPYIAIPSVYLGGRALRSLLCCHFGLLCLFLNLSVFVSTTVLLSSFLSLSLYETPCHNANLSVLYPHHPFRPILPIRLENFLSTVLTWWVEKKSNSF